MSIFNRMPKMREMFRCLIRAESLTVLVSASRFFNHLVPHVPASVPFGKQVSFGLLTGISNLHINQYITLLQNVDTRTQFMI